MYLVGFFVAVKKHFSKFSKNRHYRGFSPSGMFLVFFENIKKLAKNACNMFFCVVIYSKPEKWRPYKTAPKRAALDKGKKWKTTKKQRRSG